jgi:hypothetical protein
MSTKIDSAWTLSRFEDQIHSEIQLYCITNRKYIVLGKCYARILYQIEFYNFCLVLNEILNKLFTYDTRNWQARKHDIACGPGRLEIRSFIIPQRPFLFLLLLNVESSLLERIWQHIPLTSVNEKNIKYTCLCR